MFSDSFIALGRTVQQGRGPAACQNVPQTQDMADLARADPCGLGWPLGGYHEVATTFWTASSTSRLASPGVACPMLVTWTLKTPIVKISE